MRTRASTLTRAFVRVFRFLLASRVDQLAQRVGLQALSGGHLLYCWSHSADVRTSSSPAARLSCLCVPSMRKFRLVEQCARVCVHLCESVPQCTLCRPCAKGSFAAGTVNDLCEPCREGFYQKEEKQSACDECGSGYAEVALERRDLLLAVWHAQHPMMRHSCAASSPPGPCHRTRLNRVRALPPAESLESGTLVRAARRYVFLRAATRAHTSWETSRASRIVRIAKRGRCARAVSVRFQKMLSCRELLILAQWIAVHALTCWWRMRSHTVLSWWACSEYKLPAGHRPA
jgi:hypothetical protein